MIIRSSLDATDLHLLAAVQRQGRATVKDLSVVIGLSLSATQTRLKRLEKGPLCRYRTDIDVERVVPQVRVFVELTLADQRPEDMRRVLAVLRDQPEVLAVYHVAGAYHLMVVLMCRDVRRYHQVTEGLLQGDLGIVKLTGHIALSRVKGFAGYPLGVLSGLPLPEPEPYAAICDPDQLPKLDKVHIKLLEVLQTEGRISNIALADRVGLSPSPCLERVKRLEAAGYIGHCVAEIDLDACLSHLYLMAEATLENHDLADFDHFEARLRTLPEVISAYKISGPCDYTLDIVCRDMSHLRLVEAALLEGVPLARLRTTVVTRRLKPFAGYPLLRLAGLDGQGGRAV